MSEALQQYCLASRELQRLAASQRGPLKEARESRRAALEVLTHSLDAATPPFVFDLDGVSVSVACKTQQRFAPVTADIVEEMQHLWADDGAELAQKLLSGVDDPLETWTSALLSVLPAPRSCKRVVIKTSTLTRADASDAGDAPAYADAPPEIRELASCAARCEGVLKERTRLTSEERKAKLALKRQAEEALVREFSRGTEQEGVARCDIAVPDASGGNAVESYFVHLRPAKAAAPRRISIKLLRRKVTETLELFESVAAQARMPAQERIRRLSDPAFGKSFCEALREALREAEAPAEGRRRLTLSRIRQPTLRGR